MKMSRPTLRLCKNAEIHAGHQTLLSSCKFINSIAQFHFSKDIKIKTTTGKLINKMCKRE